MATRKRLRDHFLSCVVCTEIFRDPCTLSCFHTFCKKCVVTFTKTLPDAVSAQSLVCPVCSKLTKVQDPSKPVEKWADNIKPIHIMQGLLDSFAPGSNDTTNCSYCEKKGETNQAVFWCSVCDDALCEECIKIHKVDHVTHNHIIDYISEDAKVRNPNVTNDLSEEVKVRSRTVTCKEHPSESVRFHCLDCEKIACQTCCSIYHRRCETVVTLESQMDQMKLSLSQHKEKLMMRSKERQDRNVKQKEKLDRVIQEKNNIRSNIEVVCQQVIDNIKKKEKKLLNDLDEETDRLSEQLRADIKTGEMAMQMYQQQAELIDQAVKSHGEMDIFEMQKSCESDTGDKESEGVYTANTDVKIKFVSDTEKLQQHVEEFVLGKISVIPT